MPKRVVVTGGAGFIGSNLVKQLVSKGYTVDVIDSYVSGDNAYLDNVECNIHRMDISENVDDVAKIMEGSQAVIHLAARGSVVDSIIDPDENYNVNVFGTFNMLKAAHAASLSKFIFASTGGAIMGDTPPPVDEMTLPRPISPYGASKLCGEAYGSAFAFSHGIQFISLRFANVYGLNSLHKKGAITAFMKSLLIKKPIEIFGDGSATRDFLHVDDLCKGIILAIEEQIESKFEIFHLASGKEVSVRELADKILKISGMNEHEIIFHEKRKGEVERNFANYHKAKKLLGFTPVIDFDEGLRKVWEWTKSNFR